MNDEQLRQIARDAVPSGVYSGNVKALRAVAAAAWEEGLYAEGFIPTGPGTYEYAPAGDNPYLPVTS